MLAAIALLLLAPQQTPGVHLNQVGFYPDGEKIAVVVGAQGDEFWVAPANGGEPVFSGKLEPPREHPAWGAPARRADFSALRSPGQYRLEVPGVGASPSFEIAPEVHAEVARGAMKAFYYHRVSAPALPEYAGRWARPAGHPDDRVRVHPSAASPGRPAGTVISAPYGWYDAGDYNKYVVSSGISTGTLLALIEDYPEAVVGLETDIPESGDRVPDLLDEVLWNVRWMLSMQDPGDGGVYHKLTTAEFSGMVMPHEDTAPRFVVQKSTAAALNLAAVAAQASRVLRRYPEAAPGLADSLLHAAVAAWQWAREHPDVLYDQGGLNRRFDPDIETGAYGDRNLADEFAWAAAELLVTTGQDSFYRAVPVLADSAVTVPAWNSVRTLAYYTLVRFVDSLPPAAADELEQVRGRLITAADSLAAGAEDHPYRVPMGANPRDFVWGSSGVAANQGMLLLYAHRLTGEPRYLQRALDNLDYLLGRNPTGYSFLTGFGDRTPMHPHHRPSQADGVEDPVPGWLSGGPNPGRQDGCDYPSTVPALAYVDDLCSYASNEVAINWNAPFVYLALGVEAEMGD
ncbi:MAG TPA: glycoside hydrolase family 9 protein [Longimicrobiaceae bacterium]